MARALGRIIFIERMPSPDWSTFHHAYGGADDIPSLLGKAHVAPAPQDYRDEPWFSLWSALCHQGDVYTASYAAVPELVALAMERRSEVRAACESLFMAASIELARRAPEGSLPPPEIPSELSDPYSAAIVQGAQLAMKMLLEVQEPVAREMLVICLAAFTGDLARARLLADGPVE